MEEVYSYVQSENIAVEFFRESMSIVFASALLYLYLIKKINIIELLLFSIATESYSMIALGPTFTAKFFISFFILVDEIRIGFAKGFFIRKRFLFLLLVPLVSSLVVFLILAGNDVFSYPNGKFTYYLRPIYFYVKTYFPLFAIGSRIVREREKLSFENFTDTIKRIAFFSSIIALVQIAVVYLTRSVEISEIFGLQRRYLVQSQDDFFKLRVQAFFQEPKAYSSFLSLAIPIYFYEKKYKKVFVCFILAILTISQTFWVNILVMLILFSLFRNFKHFRLKILGTLTGIILIFLIIDSSKDFFAEQYINNQENELYQLLAKRAVSRLDVEDNEKDNAVFGIPLQTDLELPIFNFFKDNPEFIFFGYGPGNSTFINADYFLGQQTYEMRLKGSGYKYSLVTF